MTPQIRKLSREEKKALWDREYPEWTDEELLAHLHEGYAPPEIPPCRLCGAKLSVQSVGGGGATRYACTGYEERDEDDDRPLVYKPGRTCADEHYSQSVYEDFRRGGDGAVMELIRRFQQERLASEEYDEAGEYVLVAEDDRKPTWRGHAGPTEEEDETRVLKLDAKTWPVGTVITARTPKKEPT